MATGLCSKCATVDNSSSQGGDRHERPWGVEVEADFAKWPRAEVKRYMLKPSGVLLLYKHTFWRPGGAGGHRGGGDLATGL